MGFKFYKLLQYCLYVRQYYSTIVKNFTINSANKACLLCFDSKISQQMQYRSAGTNARRTQLNGGLMAASIEYNF